MFRLDVRIKIVQSKIKTLVVAVLLVLGVTSVNAITTVAGINFQDNAFADTVISSSGTYTLNGASTLQAAVTGSSLGKDAFSSLSGAFIQLGFTDNYLVNGSGIDLVLFDIGLPDTFSVTLNGKTFDYGTSSTGMTGTGANAGQEINVAAIDLSDFGIVAGAQLSSIMIGMDISGNSGTTLPSLSVAAALNSAAVTPSVPDAGSTFSLLSATLLFCGLLKRKFQKNFERKPCLI